ncbi:MAG: hypothetical protein KatS3mg038_2009 [Candidatus Kapaibacterium sp.]|nr:MAG: hypothetical protein KatS3mg038_1389 [Candidatus Kapabacteria bacterium]GIV51488.1 MAG: hypothetical protein KatS3mg038_2009 [Candidatus Kapabacteria bacterium]
MSYPCCCRTCQPLAGTNVLDPAANLLKQGDACFNRPDPITIGCNDPGADCRQDTQHDQSCNGCPCQPTLSISYSTLIAPECDPINQPCDLAFVLEGEPGWWRFYNATTQSYDGPYCGWYFRDPASPQNCIAATGPSPYHIRLPEGCCVWFGMFRLGSLLYFIGWLPTPLIGSNFDPYARSIAWDCSPGSVILPASWLGQACECCELTSAVLQWPQCT